MMLTFGHYNTLAIARHRVTRHELAVQTEFNDLMLTYYITGLLATGLIEAIDGPMDTCYELTAVGMNCLIDYERQNPELIVTRALNPYSLANLAINLPGYAIFSFCTNQLGGAFTGAVGLPFAVPAINVGNQFV